MEFVRFAWEKNLRRLHAVVPTFSLLIAHNSLPKKLFLLFFYITAQRDGHAELVSASHCEPLLTPFPRWDPETSSGWLWEVLVIYTLILGKPIQVFCLIQGTTSLLTSHYSKLKNLWLSVTSASSACNYWVMSKLTANAKTTKTHRNEVGFVCFMRISMRKHPLKTPHF